MNFIYHNNGKVVSYSDAKIKTELNQIELNVTQEQMDQIATVVKKYGLLKGGLFKPLTWGPRHRKPYQKCLGFDGLPYLSGHKTPWMYEVMSMSQVYRGAARYQIGARNQQNFSLLTNMARMQLPVMIKRNFGCTLEELYASTTYFEKDVWVCERGIRSFDTQGFRFQLDYQGITTWKMSYQIPIMVDVSHWIGSEWAKNHHPDEVYKRVLGAAKTALAAGADGIYLDIHPDPARAWTDPWQALNLERFEELMECL